MNQAAMNEVNFGGKPLKKGLPKSLAVRRVQEWLCLYGFAVAIDDSFGDATDKAVKAFQKKQGLKVTGVVDQKIYGPGIGIVREIALTGPQEIAVLVSMTG